MDYVLRTNALTKSYKGCKALSGLTMNIPKGAIYGLVGKNDAGKTTLILAQERDESLESYYVSLVGGGRDE